MHLFRSVLHCVGGFICLMSMSWTAPCKETKQRWRPSLPESSRWLSAPGPPGVVSLAGKHAPCGHTRWTRLIGFSETWRYLWSFNARTQNSNWIIMMWERLGLSVFLPAVVQPKYDITVWVGKGNESWFADKRETVNTLPEHVVIGHDFTLISHTLHLRDHRMGNPNLNSPNWRQNGPFPPLPVSRYHSPRLCFLQPPIILSTKPSLKQVCRVLGYYGFKLQGIKSLNRRHTSWFSSFILFDWLIFGFSPKDVLTFLKATVPHLSRK